MPLSKLQELRRENGELAEIIGRLGAMIAARRSPQTSALSTVRRQLSAILVPNLEMEDRTLYPRLMAADDPKIRPLSVLHHRR